MIIAILLIAVLLGVGGFAFTQAYHDHTMMTIRLAEIEAAHSEALAPYFLAALVIVAVAIVLIFYFRRPAPTITDNRTVILLGPGESKRQLYKAIGSHNALPLPPGERIERLEKQPVKLLRDGDR